MEENTTSIFRVKPEVDPSNITNADTMSELNDSLSKEVECLLQITLDIKDTTSCPRIWDNVLCWPPTAVDTKAELPCFTELNGVVYNTSTTQNATKWCFANGTWNNYTNFEGCITNLSLEKQQQPSVDYDVNSYIYTVGYSLSFTALLFAVFIFIYFKDLRCLRNTIHTHLMIAFMITDIVWILNTSLNALTYLHTNTTICAIFIIALHYFHTSTFTWMLVEGLYLYMLVVMTFTRENLRLHTYMVIGWGLPFVVMMIWGIAKAMVDLTPQINEHKELGNLKDCPWMTPHSADSIFETPIIIALGLNLIFLVQIMWVLITKLRSATNLETQQYRKLSKALLVLIPLLGFSFTITMVMPMTNIFQHTRSILLSTQGLFVATIYCFMNSEVQTTLRHHFHQWKDARDIASGASINRRYSMNKDSSLNSKKESIRMENKKKFFFKRSRQMSMSEATTVTLVGHSTGGPTTVIKLNDDDALREPLSPSENSV